MSFVKIQNRRGTYPYFDPSRLLPGEFAVVQSDDPNSTDGTGIYLCISPGVVKRLVSSEDVQSVLDTDFDTLAEDLIQDIDARTAQYTTTLQGYVTDAQTAATDAQEAAEQAQQYGVSCTDPNSDGNIIITTSTV
jgi:hypothetical protein